MTKRSGVRLASHAEPRADSFSEKGQNGGKSLSEEAGKTQAKVSVAEGVHWVEGSVKGRSPKRINIAGQNN